MSDDAAKRKKKEMPAHHRLVRVQFSVVENGYCGIRTFPNLDGTWQIVGANPEPTPGYAQHPAMHGTISLIVAPAIIVHPWSKR